MNRKDKADLLKSVVASYFAFQRYAVFYEVELHNRRVFAYRDPQCPKLCRADVLAINTRGEIIVIEVKSSRADYKADSKWRRYFPYCNKLYFAFPPDMKVPAELLTEPDVGVLQPSSTGALRVVKRCKSRVVSGKLRRATTLSVLYRGSVFNRYAGARRIHWKST